MPSECGCWVTTYNFIVCAMTFHFGQYLGCFSNIVALVYFTSFVKHIGSLAKIPVSSTVPHSSNLYAL